MNMNKFFKFYPPNQMCQRTPLTDKRFIRPTADGELCQTKQLTWRLQKIIQGAGLK